MVKQAKKAKKKSPVKGKPKIDYGAILAARSKQSNRVKKAKKAKM